MTRHIDWTLIGILGFSLGLMIFAWIGFSDVLQAAIAHISNVTAGMK